MEQKTIDHREYEDLLAPAALGALTADEHAQLRRHLRSCASCRATYSRLLVAAGMMPLTVEEREPSDALRVRLRAQIGSPAWPAASAAPAPIASIPPPGVKPEVVPLRFEPQAPDTAASRQWRIAPAWVAMAAALLVIGLIAGALAGRYLLADDGTTDVEQIAMESPTGLTLDEATLTWLPDGDVLRFSAPKLPELPEGEVYQVWLIGAEGDPPTPVGTIDDGGRFATTVDRDQFGTFAVTVEPGPLGSPGPTSDPVIVATIS